MDKKNKNKYREYYSQYFSKETFLSPKKEKFHSNLQYLQDIGLADRKSFESRRIMEIGAGKGRLTFNLWKSELLEDVVRYDVVEPSDGIYAIKEFLQLPAAHFSKSDLVQIVQEHPPGSVDLLILHGVIPHVSIPSLREIVQQVSRLISANGEIHVTSSFFGMKKAGSRALMAFSDMTPGGETVAAFLHAGLQWAMTGCRIGCVYDFYQRHFFHSFRSGFRDRYLHFNEIMSVRPYNMDWGYANHADALRDAGFSVHSCFPHSMSLRAARTDHGMMFPPRINGEDCNVVILGNDWLGKWVAANLGIAPEHCINGVEQLAGADVVIAAYDYTKGPSYAETVRSLEARGYKFGETCFIYQMFF
ncbi:class I SAM-dependent methyltransferase [Nisaea nitritireducens]|uniref:class I SAM-dependent methyltransferase n=1 Tax=Nisaea nitritireducens TaxID=568392 RepID=UPI001866D4BB|nr:class I SAM-dependent methyltransferase [Nisaea nitritireducens]